ncbi:midasin, partial [Plakobranchus ocellatus]
SRKLLTSAAARNALPDPLQALVSRCLEVVTEAFQDTSSSDLVGRGFVFVGLVLSKLLAPHGPVDPVEEATVKLAHVHKESFEIEIEQATWNRYLQIRTGRGIAETQLEHLHPRVVYLLKRKEKLASMSEKLKLWQAFRADKLQFSKLVQAISGFLETTCTTERVLDMVSKLLIPGLNTATAKTTSRSDKSQPPSWKENLSASVLQEERVWQDTTARFLDRLLDTFSTFPDILTPFAIAVHQVKFGLRMMASKFEINAKIERMSIPVDALVSLVKHLCSFPSLGEHCPNLLKLAGALASPSSLGLVSTVSGFKQLDQSEQKALNCSSVVKSRLLSCALLYLKAHSLSSARMEPSLVSSLRSVFAQFAMAWQEQEERRRQREAEEEALYRYKDKTHGDERLEMEKEEADFRASYPSFAKDFIDITGADRLEDVGLESTRASATSTSDQGIESATTGLEGVSSSEMELVCSVHYTVFTSLSKADWIEDTKKEEGRSFVASEDSHETLLNSATSQQFLLPALIAYQIGAEVVKTCSDVLGPGIDGQLLGSHVLLGTSVLQHIQTQQASVQMEAQEQQLSHFTSTNSSYNIYYDENVSEVLRCRRVLGSLLARVAQLQQEWPDHPTLLLLNQIMDRIFSFSVLSPVVKYLTGLELLLQKAQDWESNAASFVSLSPQLAEITAVIVEWRKLELSCWKNSLEREELKSKAKASHWWFHLHQLIADFLKSEDMDKSTTSEILTALKKFMESSTLGEFSVRLRMLFAFHCQLLHWHEHPAQEKLLYMLWNVYQFYKQYEPAIEAEIKRLRLPIEKQLKGFVKIARWSDMNYWALKDSTEKTHRAVHKRVKEYQYILSQPAQSMFSDAVSDLVVLTVKQTSGFSLEENMTVFSHAVIQKLNQAQEMNATTSSDISEFIKDFNLLKRAPKLFKKMTTHLKKLLATSDHLKKILIFDSFTGELIQEMQDLHGLQVDMNSEKEKQKSEARSINLRKRKGLAELFKYLALIGLSYRKGLTGSAFQSLSDALEMPPLNLNPHHELPPTKLWSGCENYFYRCISRYAQFASAIGNPSKELSMADIQRCRGFIAHLGHLYLKQKARLTEIVNSYLYLRKLLHSLKALDDSSSNMFLPPQSQSREWLESTKSLTTQLSQGLGQFLLLLDSCPRKGQINNSECQPYPSPFPAERLAPSALWIHGDPNWQQCFEKTQALYKLVLQEQDKIDSLLGKAILGRADIQCVSSTLEVYESFVATIKFVISQFTASNNSISEDECGSSSNSSLVSSLTYLSSVITQTKQGFCLWWKNLERAFILTERAAGLQDSLVYLQASQSSEAHEANQGTGSVPRPQKSAELSNISQFLSSAEDLMESLLISVQNVVQAETKDASVENNDNSQAKQEENKTEQEDEEELLDAHLSQHLLEKEKKIIKDLNCSKILAKLSTIMDNLNRMSDCVELDNHCQGSNNGDPRVSSVQDPQSADSVAALTSCVQVLLRCQPLVVAFSSLVESQVGQGVAIHRSLGKLLSVLLAIFTELAQKGFCIPPELSEEMEGEGATEFKDIEGGGIGEGEGTKDVSDQIETEDQLEEAKRPDQVEAAEESENQPDIPAEDNAIEMSEDFQGKLHDQEDTEGVEKDEDDNDDDDEAEKDEDMDKEMGEADGQQDHLQERMWGSEDEDENDEKKDMKEDDVGGGMDQHMEESVAKDDNKNTSEAKGDESAEEQRKDNADEDEEAKELPEDNDEYDDNKVDPHNPNEKERDAENLDLPDDIDLDDGEKKGQDEEDMEIDENESPAEDKDQRDERTEHDGDDREEECKEEMAETKGNDENEDEGNVPNTEAEQQEVEEDGNGIDGTSGQDEEEKEEEPFGELKDKEDQAKPEVQDQIDAADTKAVGDATQQANLADTQDEERGKGGLEQEEPSSRDEQDREQKGVGASNSEDPLGTTGEISNQTTESSSTQQNMKKQLKPGETDDQRSLGSHDKKHGRLKTREQDNKGEEQDSNGKDDDEIEEKDLASKEYQHVKDPKSHWDAQTVDTATQEQVQETQAVPTQDEEDQYDVSEEDNLMMDEQQEDINEGQVQEKRSAKSKTGSNDQDSEEKGIESDNSRKVEETEKVEVDGERVLTHTVEHRPESTIHTVLENLYLDPMVLDGDVEEIRSELEQKVAIWSHSGEEGADLARAASEAWQKYQAITCSLSQELCEQLRLILEPSLATKLKGDYRTGKRLNMRKVIPYIASQFRKDKIWLRRSKPSKRQYQIMIAVDDSASMADNHSKQLAFESLALVSNALTLLESGELAVCSFGEDVRVLHPFFEPFTHQSGAHILQHLTCEQKQTKYGQLLDTALSLMQQAQVRAGPGISGTEQPAQLLLILSDGHGVFREGMDLVKRAVRRARQARLFLVFLILDNPDKKGSLLDARVPIIEASGKIQEIKSYMELFPFPFYIFLRDINSMPQILSDALRQWFELVTACDK